MSYDITLCAIGPGTARFEIDTDLNITSNLSRLFMEAGCHPHEFDGSTTTVALPHIVAGIADIEARPDHYKEFEAANGWGKTRDALRFLNQFKAACEEFPDCEISVS